MLGRYACLLALAFCSLAPGLAPAAPLPSSLADQPVFVRAQPRVLERLDDLMAAARTTPAARPAAPSPCNANDSGTNVTFTWTGVPGATGYHIFRDGNYFGSLLAPVTSYQEFPGPGMHSYCVVAYNTDGISDPCCDNGEQTQLPPFTSCNIQTNLNQNIFSWTPVIGAVSYKVTRDGVLFATTASTTVTDFPVATGAHEYCVQATASGLEPSDPCCKQAFNFFPPSTPTCSVTSEVGRNVFRWTTVPHTDRYQITRDGQLLTNVFPPETTLVDSVSGPRLYCVQAINGAGASGLCCKLGNAVPITGHSRLSWGVCSPQVSDQGFHGPGVYSLVLSVSELSFPNIGHDSQITIHPSIPDAWRFDAGGCQAESWTAEVVSQSGCPAMLGANSLRITNYAIDPNDGSAQLRLAIVYDNLLTDGATRYTLWRINFDHAASIGASDADPNTCDGADQPLYFTVTAQVLLASGQPAFCVPETNDQVVTWNGSPVPGKPVTWGRLKGLYR